MASLAVQHWAAGFAVLMEREPSFLERLPDSFNAQSEAVIDVADHLPHEFVLVFHPDLEAGRRWQVLHYLAARGLCLGEKPEKVILADARLRAGPFHDLNDEMALDGPSRELAGRFNGLRTEAFRFVRGHRGRPSRETA